MKGYLEKCLNDVRLEEEQEKEVEDEGKTSIFLDAGSNNWNQRDN